MKSALLFLVAYFLSGVAVAQHTVHLRDLWEKPQVHVLFEGYTLSFTIRDINRAIQLLNEAGDTTYDTTSGLDTHLVYKIELYPGKMEYKNTLQPLLQNGVGAFLMAAGKVDVRAGRRKKLTDLNVDIESLGPDKDFFAVTIRDPKNDKMVFWGKMKTSLYNKDLGIDY